MAESMEYVSRNGPVTAVDSLTAIADIVATASGNIVVNKEADYIVQIIIACTADSAATGAATMMVRLTGTALSPNTQDFAAGAVGGTLATGAAVQATPLVLPTKIKVTGGGNFGIQAAMLEVDIGTAVFIVAIGFHLVNA